MNRAVVEGSALGLLALAVLALWVRSRFQARLESDGGTITREGLRYEADRV